MQFVAALNEFSLFLAFSLLFVAISFDSFLAVDCKHRDRTVSIRTAT